MNLTDLTKEERLLLKPIAERIRSTVTTARMLMRYKAMGLDYLIENFANEDQHIQTATGDDEIQFEKKELSYTEFRIRTIFGHRF